MNIESESLTNFRKKIGRPRKLDNKGKGRSVFLSDELWSKVTEQSNVTKISKSKFIEKTIRSFFGL